MLTATAILSIAIGTLSLIVILSVMRGFRHELSERLLGFNAHITFTSTDRESVFGVEQLRKLLGDADVKSIAPFVQGEVIAESDTTGEVIAQGARVRGIDPAMLGSLSGVEFLFPRESPLFDILNRRSEKDGLPFAIIGSEIVTQLAVHPDFSDIIELIAPLAEVGPTGDLTPNHRKFVVGGLFRAGVFDLDSKYILVSLRDAETLLGEQATMGWQVRVGDVRDVPALVEGLSDKLPHGWNVSGWHEENRKLFAALKLERVAMGAILIMVLIIASFSIAGTILLITASKRRDIAILESIGMRKSVLRRVFVLNAAFIGACGSILGLFGGLLLCTFIRRWPIRLPESYYLDWLPVDVNLLFSILFAITGVAIAIIASLLPVRQSTRTNPVHVLRYE